jgi:REP element-mobilizing transposase RayT
MSHSLTRIWIHGIWATKERYPFILPSIEKKIYDLLYEEFNEAKSPARIINGMEEHVHALFLLSPLLSSSQVFKQIKGCSSHTINVEELTIEKFCWQTGYAAYSVSESQVEKVFQYIKNQKTIHRNRTFQEEYAELSQLHGIPGK